MTSCRSAPVGMATRARSTASGIARLQARAPAPGRVQPGTCLSQETVGATGSIAAIPIGPVGNAPRSFPIGGTPISPDLSHLPLGGEHSLRGDFPTPADGVLPQLPSVGSIRGFSLARVVSPLSHDISSSCQYVILTC
jgi:hypothetical protein